MMHSYLVKVDGVFVERPQFMYMRVAIAIHKHDLSSVLSTYDALSRQLYTQATPTLFNAGTAVKSYSSCFLYQPDATGTLALLGSALDLDRFWANDGGVGMSLATVPGRRCVALWISTPTAL